MGENLALFSNKVLRSAIQRNRVSFPAQAPVFVKQHAGEIQARIAHLYFISGWAVRDLAARYSMNPENTRKMLNDWRARAISSGYIQEIEPDEIGYPLVEDIVSSRESGRTGIESETKEERSKSFSIVRRTTEMPTSNPRWLRAPSNHIHAMFLDQIEMAVGTSRWPAFCLRLLAILKQDCIRCDFRVAVAQIDRIEAAEKRDANVARDLLRDLRVRMLDEECVCASTENTDESPGLLRALALEIETSVREAALHGSPTMAMWPVHCSWLLAAIKEGCSKLRLRLTAAQVSRIEDAVSGEPYQLGDLVRDLGNRMVDELEYKKPFDLPVVSQRTLAAGAAR